MSNPSQAVSNVDRDDRGLLSALLRRLPYIVVFGAIVAAGTFYLLGRMEPVYRATATVLIVPGQSDLTRPQTGAEAASTVDREAIGNQIQLIRSRDIAETVAAQVDLAASPEFNPAPGPSWSDQLLALAGIHRSPVSVPPEERVLAEYFARLSVYPVAGSRVIGIDFSSENPQLAAAGANAVAEAYIAMQRDAQSASTADAVQGLSAQIVDVRAKVKAAEAKVESYRTANDLLAGGGVAPSTLSQQQLSDLNAELTRVRAARAEAGVKAAQIKAMLAAGNAGSASDVLNSPLIQRLVEQQVALRAEIAQLNATLLPQHPRMRELSAQVADLDRQVAAEAGKVLESVESQSRLATARETEIGRTLMAMKTTAANANDASVELRALEREAAAQRDLLESYLARYREALAREEADSMPAEARFVSRAAVPIAPSFPQTLPMTLAAAAAAFLLSLAFVTLRHLSRGGARRAVAMPVPAMPAAPTADHARWADDNSVRRIMPKEPTLVPEMVDRVEESLAIIAGEIVQSGKKRVLVTLAEGSDEQGRPLGAVALARALARTDARVVLVDFRADGANAASMGEGADLPGFSDLFDGDASFAQAIFRDRRSRVHFIPAGRKPLRPELLDREQLETVLSALTLTYDYVLLDAADEMVPVVGPSCGTAMVVSEFAADDPRTVDAFDRVGDVSDAKVLLLMVDASTGESRDAKPETAGAAA